MDNKVNVKPAIPPEEQKKKLLLVRSAEYACYVKLKDLIKILEARRGELTMPEKVKLEEALVAVRSRDTGVADYLNSLEKDDK